MDFQRGKSPGFLHRKFHIDAMYDVRYIYLHILDVFDGKCRFIYHAAPLSWYELHQSSKVTTFEFFFFPEKNAMPRFSVAPFAWESHATTTGGATSTLNDFLLLEMVRYDQSHRAKTRKKSMNLPHCVCLRRPFWRHSCILSQEISLKVRFTGLYYIWLSRTEPWIVFSLHV